MKLFEAGQLPFRVGAHERSFAADGMQEKNFGSKLRYGDFVTLEDLGGLPERDFDRQRLGFTESRGM